MAAHEIVQWNFQTDTAILPLMSTGRQEALQVVVEESAKSSVSQHCVISWIVVIQHWFHAFA